MKRKQGEGLCIYDFSTLVFVHLLGREHSTLRYAKDKTAQTLILVRTVIAINSKLQSHVSVLCPNKYLIIPHKQVTFQQEKAK